MFRSAATAANVLRSRCLIHRPFNAFVEATKFFSRCFSSPSATRLNSIDIPGPSSSDVDCFIGKVVKLNRHKKDWCVAEVWDEESKSQAKVVGVMPGLACGATAEFLGTWSQSPTYGKQFKVVTFIQHMSLECIATYLSTVPNVGEVIASKIVEKFGDYTVAVLSGKDTTRSLQEVDGIGQKRAASIQEDWQKHAILWNVIMRLDSTWPVNLCKRIVAKFGEKALEVINSNPYRLYKEVSGITFKRADAIALKMGIKLDNPLRIEAGLHFELEKAQKDGHTARSVPHLVHEASKMLELKENDMIRDGINQLAHIGDVKLTAIGGLEYAQLPFLADAEEDIAAFLNRARPATAIALNKAIKRVEKQPGLSFSDSQIAAISSALTNQVTVLTGGPGTGKTAICQALVEILKARNADVKIVLAAPTGRAAKRLSDATKCRASTIHCLLKCVWKDDSVYGSSTTKRISSLPISSLLMRPQCWIHPLRPA